MSITLAAAAISTRTLGGVTKETNNTDAVQNLQVDFQQNTLSFTIIGGTLAGQVFTPGSTLADNVQVTVDLTTGRWNASNGTTGTLNGGGLTALQNTLKSLRNSGETFATGNAIIAGTQVAWT